jgi:hypothetical protein
MCYQSTYNTYATASPNAFRTDQPEAESTQHCSLIKTYEMIQTNYFWLFQLITVASAHPATISVPAHHYTGLLYANIVFVISQSDVVS